MTDETHDRAAELRARMTALQEEARGMLAEMGLHEQMRVAHANLRQAIADRADAEIAYMDLRMQRRDEWESIGFDATPINDAGDCAASAGHVRARWRHEQADQRFREVEVAWLEWVASGAGNGG